jgi:hypothetical protein
MVAGALPNCPITRPKSADNFDVPFRYEGNPPKRHCKNSESHEEIPEIAAACLHVTYTLRVEAWNSRKRDLFCLTRNVLARPS